MERIRKADGDALRLFRERRWLTQRQLAELAGVSRATVVELESGRNKDPRNDTLKAIAAALKINPDELLEGTNGNGPLGVARPSLGRLLDGDQPPEAPMFGTG